jgi:hypothetical protein
VNEITLVVDYDEEIGFYYFIVKEGETTLSFRPGFRTREEAERVGDLWIREQLGAERKQDDEDRTQ